MQAGKTMTPLTPPGLMSQYNQMIGSTNDDRTMGVQNWFRISKGDFFF